jgi:hypothetical protein
MEYAIVLLQDRRWGITKCTQVGPQVRPRRHDHIGQVVDLSLSLQFKFIDAVKQIQMTIDNQISLDAAQELLAIFGITRRSREFKRLVKNNEFNLANFDRVLFESTFIIIVDWRSCLSEVLSPIQTALALLDVDLVFDVDTHDIVGKLKCQSKTIKVRYVPSQHTDFDTVIHRLQSILPSHIEFRSSPLYDGTDSWAYAVLPRQKWELLESIEGIPIGHFFQPLNRKRDNHQTQQSGPWRRFWSWVLNSATRRAET